MVVVYRVMSKLIISADIHFCKRESLVDNRYSHLVNSFVWLDSLQGDFHFDLGDMFNTSTLSAEDVAVLETIKFKNSWHCITGNHEQDGQNSLLKYFRDIHVIYEKPQLKNFGKDIGWVLFLPFMKEVGTLDQYLNKLPQGESAIVLSHCEFLGMFGSEGGFNVGEITKDSRIKIWFNGHYHQRALVSPKIIIVGNLLGKNFTQNFDPHGVCIYDTSTNTYEFVENPYALTFGKMDTGKKECLAIRKLVEGDVNCRYVLAIQTDSESKDALKAWADKYLVASRILISDVCGVGSGGVIEFDDGKPLAVDHIGLFFREVGIRFGEEIVYAIRKN